MLGDGKNIWSRLLTFHIRLVQSTMPWRMKQLWLLTIFGILCTGCTSQIEREERLARRNRETAGERVTAESKTDTALACYYWASFHNAYMDAKAMPTNDTDYGCHTKTIELSYGVYITPHHTTIVINSLGADTCTHIQTHMHTDIHTETILRHQACWPQAGPCLV